MALLNADDKKEEAIIASGIESENSTRPSDDIQQRSRKAAMQHSQSKLLKTILKQEIRNRVKRDPHALGEWRVNGALPHIQAFYDAFGIKKGDKMYLPENQRLELW